MTFWQLVTAFFGMVVLARLGHPDKKWGQCIKLTLQTGLIAAMITGGVSLIFDTSRFLASEFYEYFYEE